MRQLKIKIHDPLNETCLKFLSIKDDLLLKRGFKPETLRKYEVGFWSRLGTFMHNRLIFPIRDAQGFLVGFSGRTIYSESDWDKYKIKAKWVHGRHFDRWPQPDDLQTGSILYNLFRALKHIGPNKELILVEGPLDGLRLDEAGIYNWVAILGCSFGPIHRTMLIDFGIIKLVLALDTDQAGQEASNKIEEFVKDFFHVDRPKLLHDPGKSSIDELKATFYVN
jgi:DNA primase